MTSVQQFIDEKEGFIINTFRENGRPYVEFLCKNGHFNQKRTDTVTGRGRSGSTWCLECTRLTIEQVHLVAEKRGFKFLSEIYINCKTSYNWECPNGHIFSARYYNVYSGKGCVFCNRVPYEKVMEIVRSKEGECLTLKDDFKGGKTKLKVRCSSGHTWTTTYFRLNQGSWCPKCQEGISERTCRAIIEFIYKKKFPKKRPLWLISRFGGRLELDGYCKPLNIAFEYNGKQHYKFVAHWHKTKDMLERQQQRDEDTQKLCEENKTHLVVIPYTVKYEDLYTYILSKCINVPENTPEKIDYSILKIQGANKGKLTEISEYVKETWNGTLLSTKYLRNTTKMDFECCDGHKFKQTWCSIQAGIFCKKCTYEPIRRKMEGIVRNFCEKNGYTLLSPYTLAKDKLNLECSSCKKQRTTTWDILRKSDKAHCVNTYGTL